MNELYISQYGPVNPEKTNESFYTITADKSKTCMSVNCNGEIKNPNYKGVSWMFLDESARPFWTGETKHYHNLLLGKTY